MSNENFLPNEVLRARLVVECENYVNAYSMPSRLMTKDNLLKLFERKIQSLSSHITFNYDLDEQEALR